MKIKTHHCDMYGKRTATKMSMRSAAIAPMIGLNVTRYVHMPNQDGW